MSESPAGPSEPTPGPETPSQAPERKGLSPLTWVLIVLGTLVLLSAGACVACGVVFMNTAREFTDNPARAAAELAIRADPDLELVDSDPDSGSLTVRNKQTGEEATFDFDEIAEGRFSWSTAEGEGGIDVSGEGEEGRMTVRSGDSTTTFGAGANEDLPGWLPVYPGGAIDTAGFATREEERVAGSLQVVTDDDVEAATETWREALTAAGFDVSLQSFEAADGAASSILVAESEEPRRQVTVTVSREEERTRMLVQYDGVPDSGR